VRLAIPWPVVAFCSALVVIREVLEGIRACSARVASDCSLLQSVPGPQRGGVQIHAVGASCRRWLEPAASARAGEDGDTHTKAKRGGVSHAVSFG
jgi:hypothetical protein